MKFIKKLNKKAQHEIVGFVLIVLIVSVIGIVFLSLMIGRGGSDIQSSIEISNLLQSSMQCTTDCAIRYIPEYESGQDLVKECFKNPSQFCLNQKTVCQSLAENLKEIIDKSLAIGPDYPNKAYKMNIYYIPLDNPEQGQQVLYFEEGIFSNCTSIPGGGHSIAISRFGYGTISLELEVCRGI